MDYNDAVNQLVKANPDVHYSEVRSAMDSEVSAELSGNKSTRAYQRAIETAYARIVDWLATGEEYAVTCTWRDMAKFAASHRTACVWAVCVSNARAQAREQAALENEELRKELDGEDQ